MERCSSGAWSIFTGLAACWAGLQAACATSGRGRGAKLAVVAARQVAPPVQVVVRVGAVRCGASTRVGLALAPARRRSSVLRAVTTEAMTEEEDATDDNTEEDLDEYMSFTEVNTLARH